VKRLVKRIIVVVCVLLIALSAAVSIVAWRASRVPDWYEQARVISTQPAYEQTLVPTSNWIDRTTAGNLDAKPAEQKQHTLELSTDQINTLLAKWSAQSNGRLRESRVRLEPAGITIAGKMDDKNRVISITFKPVPTDSGIGLALESVSVGNQQVPLSSVASRGRDAGLQTLAGIDADAITIDDASHASAAAALAFYASSGLSMLDGRAAAPYVFVPSIGSGGRVTMAKIRSLRPDTDMLHVVLEIPEAAERRRLVEHLRNTVLSAQPPRSGS
jgi:uncharacterized protein YpmS